MNLSKQVNLKLKGTNEQIKNFVDNYCKMLKVSYTNLVITDDEVTFTTYSNLPYEQLVNQLVAERYTIQDELAIQRKYKKGVNEIEFNEYDAYVEECKVKAKQFITERESALNDIK